MFKPASAPVSVLETPCPIIIEFTDYASYQHHELRRQQYQRQLELQEQKRQQDEDQRQYQLQLQTQLQDHQLQCPFPIQPPFPHLFATAHQQPATLLSTPFRQQLSLEVPSEVPPDYRAVVYQHQAQPQRDPMAAVAHIRSHSLTETTSSFVDTNSPVQQGLFYYGSSFDTPQQPGFVEDLDAINNSQAQAPGAQLFSDSSSTAPSPVNVINPLAHTTTPSTTPSAAAAAAASSSFPVISPPVSSDSDLLHFSSPSPTNFAAATPPPSAPPAPAPAPAPASSVSSSSYLPSNTTATITAVTTDAPGILISNPLRQHQHQHPRRPHHHHLNSSSSPHDHQPFHQHTAHPYKYHLHLQQQIQERRTKRALTFPTVQSGVYGYDCSYASLSGPPTHVGSVDPFSAQLLQSHQHPYQQQQHQHQHQHLHRQHHQYHQHHQELPEQIQPPAPYPTTHLIYPPYPVAMPADFAQTTALDQDAIAADIAAQQAAAQGYRPDTEGPGIGEIHPAEDIQKLYTNADPSFVEKTQKLPRAFPLYRPVRGDGNCGWRAIGFCYFELLVHSGDADLIAKERARLLGLNDYIRNVGGYDPYLYEDMVEETDILFGNIISVYPDVGKAMEAVSTAFNDVGASNAIIYHLRLLAASYLKENAEKYDGFLAHDMGVVGYCQDWIERPNCEIDHLRMELLTTVLLKSSDMVLEIAYLDRSESPVLPTYKFPESNIGRRESTIVRRMSLLFRPDHYDILYRPSQPSRAVAQEVLSRYHTPDQVATALKLDWTRAATIVAGEPVTPELEAVDAPGAATELTSTAVPNTFTPAQSNDAYPVHASLSIYEGTPDLTPGSSINSPAYFQHKGEPMTPVLAPSSGSSRAAPQISPAVVGTGGDGVLESATASTSSGLVLVPEAVGSAGQAVDEGNVAVESGNNGLATVTPTAATTGAVTTSSSGERNLLVDDAREGQASAAQEASGSTTSAPTATNAPSSNDYQVFHVGNITYGNTSSSQAHQSSLGTGMDLFSQLPHIFGNASSEVNSALFGTGNWSSSALRTRYSDAFASSPMASFPPPSEVPGQPTQVDAAATTSTTPAPDLPAPMEPVKGGSSAEAKKETLLRFSQWHYEGKKATHDAMDRQSISFRSKMSTAAHFCSSDFQPDVYDPTGNE